MICTRCHSHALPYEVVQDIGGIEYYACIICGAHNHTVKMSGRSVKVQPIVPDVIDVLKNPKTSISSDIRLPQVAIAEEIEDAIVEGKSCITEAGTGTGKTWAYLTPALASPGKVIVATATKALQDQIMQPGGDGDIVVNHFNKMGFDRDIALLKGKGNYACKQTYKVKKKRKEIPDKTAQDAQDRERVEKYFKEAGKKQHYAEIDKFPDPPSWFYDLRVDECAKDKCRYASKCGYLNNKWDAENADVVVANHALVATEYKIGKLLSSEANDMSDFIFGPRDAIVFDEAHQLESQFENVWSEELRKVTFSQLINRMKDYVRPSGDPGTYTQCIYPDLETEINCTIKTNGELDSYPGIGCFDRRVGEQLQEYFDDVVKLAGVGKKRENVLLGDDGIDKGAIQEKMMGIYTCLSAMEKGIKDAFNDMTAILSGDRSEFRNPVSDDDFDEFLQDYYKIKSDYRRIARWQEFAKSWVHDYDSYAHYFQYVNGREVLVKKPIEIAPLLQDFWAKNNVIMSSATMSKKVRGEPSFGLFQRRLGTHIPDERCHSVDSPFNYRKQCLLYLERDSKFRKPKPWRTREKLTYFDNMAAEIGDWLETTRGNTLILFASYEDLEEISDRLHDHPTITKMGLPLIQQTRMRSVGSLVEQYERRARDMIYTLPVRKGPVLMGVQSLWEGISVKTPMLNSVIVTRIPFPNPRDPIHRKREEKLGKHAFNILSLYPATISMRQGTGRLIRSKSDVGIVVSLDAKLASSSQWAYNMRKDLDVSERSTFKKSVAKKYVKKLNAHIQKGVDALKESQ